MSEQHIVYAVVDRGPLADPIKVRVSDPLPWGLAIDFWYSVDDLRIWSPSVDLDITAAHMPVRHFCVRSADDPMWPSENPRSLVRIKQIGLEVS